MTDEENPIPTEPWALRINTMVLIGLQVEGSHSLLLVRTSNKSKSICAISKRLGYGEPEKIIIRGTILDRYASQTSLKHQIRLGELCLAVGGGGRRKGVKGSTGERVAASATSETKGWHPGISCSIKVSIYCSSSRSVTF